MQLDIHHLREDYTKDSLDISTTADHPFQQFHTWFKEAQASSVAEPNAMTLATVTPEGRPKARIMLLKQLDSTGFVFFTNYGSAKGKDLTHNPQASLLFFWDALQRQVRISGVVERISREESIAYFQSRPKGSQIGAIASPQSQVLEGRQQLEETVSLLEQQYAHNEALPCPEHWGGFRLLPDEIEFWQGRSSRLHDRIRYRLATGNAWIKERLAP